MGMEKGEPPGESRKQQRPKEKGRRTPKRKGIEKGAKRRKHEGGTIKGERK